MLIVARRCWGRLQRKSCTRIGSDNQRSSEDTSAGVQQKWNSAIWLLLRIRESSRSGSDDWAEILTVTTEGRLDALQRIHFLNDRTAYLSAQWQFAVTIDGGDTWRVWDAYRELRSLGVSYQGPYIRSASLSPDGNGSLVVIDAWWSAAEFSEAKHLQQLHTRDFGQHWSR
jgi:hypothetical protein